MVVSEPCPVSSLLASPWKNGGGSTRTLSIKPPGAGMDTFLWRISLAEVNSPGDFSQFPGIDRTILLWQGNGLVLKTFDWSFTLQQPFLPVSFSGDDQIACDLIAGPTTDLNIMVRRGAGHAVVQVAHGAVTLTQPVETTIVLSAIGNVQILAGGRPGSIIGPNEFVCIQDCQPGTILAPSASDATFVVISLSQLQTKARPAVTGLKQNEHARGRP
jgi:uncharacterized protein